MQQGGGPHPKQCRRMGTLAVPVIFHHVSVSTTNLYDTFASTLTQPFHSSWYLIMSTSHFYDPSILGQGVWATISRAGAFQN
jgi:hypothetical protein